MNVFWTSKLDELFVVNNLWEYWVTDKIVWYFCVWLSAQRDFSRYKTEANHSSWYHSLEKWKKYMTEYFKRSRSLSLHLPLSLTTSLSLSLSFPFSPPPSLSKNMFQRKLIIESNVKVFYFLSSVRSLVEICSNPVLLWVFVEAAQDVSASKF